MAALDEYVVQVHSSKTSSDSDARNKLMLVVKGEGWDGAKISSSYRAGEGMMHDGS